MADESVKVLGRYALYGEIAAGGMATVHLGRLLGPIGFSKTVAIKRLHPQFAKDPDFVAMFLDEARVAARIQHPNVVSTLDVVALDGELFLVMEYVEGESLAKLIRVSRAAHTRIPARVVGSIMSSTLYGLHAAHEAKSERGEPLGIIHRDVSPQNVLVGTDGVARVLDFGVAKARGRAHTTRDGQIKGKLAYMPPEQIMGEELDRRVDVYAAGVVVWEALVGQRLFDGDNEGAVLQKIIEARFSPPSALSPDIPRAADEVVLKALSKDPNQRFATAWEMAVALEETLGLETPRRVGAFVEACARESIARRAARVQQLESMPTDADAGAALDPSAIIAPQTLRPPQNRKAAIAVGAIIGVGAAAAMLLFVTKREVAPPAETAPQLAAADAAGEPVATSSAQGVAVVSSTSTTIAASTSAAVTTVVPEQVPSGSRPPLSKAVVKPTATVVAAKPTATAAVTAKVPSCDPAYYIDNGIRKIKPECLK